MWEHKVVEMNLSGARAVEDRLNELASQDWEHYDTSSIGPMVRLFFRRYKRR
jgi:hypothetical protein